MQVWLTKVLILSTVQQSSGPATALLNTATLEACRAWGLLLAARLFSLLAAVCCGIDWLIRKSACLGPKSIRNEAKMITKWNQNDSKNYLEGAWDAFLEAFGDLGESHFLICVDAIFGSIFGVFWSIWDRNSMQMCEHWYRKITTHMPQLFNDSAKLTQTFVTVQKLGCSCKSDLVERIALL